MTVTIGRRELLAGLGGAAVARPLAARGQGDADGWVPQRQDTPQLLGYACE